MYKFVSNLKVAWLRMVEPPWRHSGSKVDLRDHWIMWLIGWAWALAGLVLGAVVSPSVVQFVGLWDTAYQGTVVIGVAVLAGFLVQFLGWCLVALVAEIGLTMNTGIVSIHIPLPWNVVTLLLSVVPPIGVGYGVYRYLTWVGAGQRSVTVAFVGALLVKTFLIPFIKGLVTGAIFKWFMRWLRGDKAKAKGA